MDLRTSDQELGLVGYHENDASFCVADSGSVLGNVLEGGGWDGAYDVLLVYQGDEQGSGKGYEALHL